MIDDGNTAVRMQGDMPVRIAECTTALEHFGFAAVELDLDFEGYFEDFGLAVIVVYFVLAMVPEMFGGESVVAAESLADSLPRDVTECDFHKAPQLLPKERTFRSAALLQVQMKWKLAFFQSQPKEIPR